MYSYNQAGRVTAQRMYTTLARPWAPPQPLDLIASYQWDNEGRMTALTYPTVGTFAPLELTYQYDAMGRLGGITAQQPDQFGGYTAPYAAASAGYGAAGELASLSYFGVSETRTYNTLGQLTAITNGLMNMQYRYSTSGQNNGRIAQSADAVTGETVTYQYDALNRLVRAETADNAWGEAYTYDGFGNLAGKTPTKGTAPALSLGYDAATNRPFGFNFDGNGNATGDTGWSYGWDVENRMVGSSTGGYTGNMWNYDPWGKRVMSGWEDQQSGYWGGSWEFDFYGITGQRLAAVTCAWNEAGTERDCSLKTMNVYFGGKPIGTMYNPLFGTGAAPVATDRLGSVRSTAVVNTWQGSSYFPYGEERTATSDGREKFGTYYRDRAGQDYADQRYYSSITGRFLTPDPSGADAVDVQNPTSWNMYAYVNGDPVNFNDPDGLDCSTVRLQGWAGIPFGTTVGDFLSKNSDLSIFAETVFTESRIGWDDDAAYEKAAISAVIMNRWQIVSGYYDLYTGPVGRRGSSQVRTVPDWGNADGTVGSIVYAEGQFAVWSSPGHLDSDSQKRLNAALKADEMSDQCSSLLQSIGTVAGFWSARNDHTMYASAEGIIFTSFGSGAGAANKSYYETTIGSFGSANVFYGVSQSQIWPHGVPLPRPPIPRPRPPRPRTPVRE